MFFWEWNWLLERSQVRATDKALDVDWKILFYFVKEEILFSWKLIFDIIRALKPSFSPVFNLLLSSTDLKLVQFSSVQSLSHARLFATPWIAARQASLSITNSGVHSNSRSSSRSCHPAISSPVIPFSSCPQSLPASEWSWEIKIFILDLILRTC